MSASGSRPWAPSAYQAAVVLSGLSAILGLGRELLVVRRLHFGEVNDALTFALSITYTIALLGDPLRLGALNLLGRRPGSAITLTIVTGILVAATLTTVMYTRGGALPAEWVLTAGSAGAANLLLAWVLPRMQRTGPFLPVHAVTIMPNIIIVTGILIPAASDQVFAARVIGLFLLCPVTQLIALALLRTRSRPPALDPPPTVAEGLSPMRWHVVGAAGGQGAQYFLRTALLAAATGSLAKFNLVLRVSDTIRAIFVDTYIASRIRRWAAGAKTADGVVDGRWLGSGGLGAIGLGGLALALAWPARPGVWPSAIELALGTYLVLALRVRYQSLNTGAQPLDLNRRMAATELAAAALAAGLALTGVGPVALIPWVIYVAKPAAGLVLVPPVHAAQGALTPES